MSRTSINIFRFRQYLRHLMQKCQSKLGFSRRGAELSATMTKLEYDKNPLVKNIPSHLDQHYQMLTEENVVDLMFTRLRYKIFTGSEVRRNSTRMKAPFVSPKFIKDAGTIGDESRGYFYLKPMNEQGWLFEKSGPGWVISRADKIIDRNLYIKPSENWDTVVLFASDNPNKLPRVSSTRYGSHLLSFASYEAKLMSELGITTSIE